MLIPVSPVWTESLERSRTPRFGLDRSRLGDCVGQRSDEYLRQSTPRSCEEIRNGKLKSLWPIRDRQMSSARSLAEHERRSPDSAIASLADRTDSNLTFISCSSCNETGDKTQVVLRSWSYYVHHFDLRQSPIAFRYFARTKVMVRIKAVQYRPAHPQ